MRHPILYITATPQEESVLERILGFSKTEPLTDKRGLVLTDAIRTGRSVQ